MGADDSEHDDDYMEMDGGKPKYANARERTEAKYKDKAHEQPSLKDDPKMDGGMKLLVLQKP